MASNSVCTSCLRALRYQRLAKHTERTPVPSLRWIQGPVRSLNILPEQPAQAPAKRNENATPTPISAAEHRQILSKSQPREESTATRIARKMRERASASTETYIAYGVTDKLFKECARQADYTIPQALEKGGTAPKTAAGEDLGVGRGWWYESLGLTPTFTTWAQVTFLYMYILTVRIRYFPPNYAPTWHQHLINHFSYAAEDRMVTYHGMASSSIRNKYLKDVFLQWRGALAAYDEGLVRGDAWLGAAIWRNVFKGAEDTDPRHLALIVAWMRRSLNVLDELGDEVVAKGLFSFDHPDEKMTLLNARSKGLLEPLGVNQQPTKSPTAKT